MIKNNKEKKTLFSICQTYSWNEDGLKLFHIREYRPKKLLLHPYTNHSNNNQLDHLHIYHFYRCKSLSQGQKFEENLRIYSRIDSHKVIHENQTRLLLNFKISTICRSARMILDKTSYYCWKVTLWTHAEAGFKLACHLPHCRYTTWSPLAVSELHLSAATPLWPFHCGITLKLNKSQLSAVCRFGQNRKMIDWLAWCCLPLGLPSVASGACTVVWISPSKRQCSELQASLNAAW